MTRSYCSPQFSTQGPDVTALGSLTICADAIVLPLAAGICDMAAGNSFLPEFMKQYNDKFSVRATKTENMHRKPNVQASRLADILCHRELRHVSQQLSVAYERRQIILQRRAVADKLAGQDVELYDFSDRPLEVRWKATRFPIASSAKTSVSAIPPSENKRLSHGCHRKSAAGHQA